MILFYSHDLNNDTAILEEDEYQHCCKVLRNKVGAPVSLTDGKGLKAIGIITHISKHKAEVKLSEVINYPKLDFTSHLYVSPPKNRARWEWLLEKAVEIGIDTITPLITYHSEKTKINEVRAQKIMRSAALQCLRPHHPLLQSSLTLKALLKKALPHTDKYIASYNPDNTDLIKINKVNKNALILIGPEGDFSTEEIEDCIKEGFECVNISTHRLRTETAAITSTNILKLMGY